MAQRRQKFSETRNGSLLVLVLTAVLVIAAAAFVQGRAGDDGMRSVDLSGPTTGPAPKVGKPAPLFRATDVEGNLVSLKDFRGRPVWITFGASWCQECLAEAVDIENSYQEMKRDDGVVIGIFIQEDDKAVVDYADRVGLTFPKIADPDTAIASEYRILGIPSHYFVDRKGVLRDIETGAMTPEKMDKVLEKIE